MGRRSEVLLASDGQQPVKLRCPCGCDEFRLFDDWIVRCKGCHELVGFWNPFEPVEVPCFH